jgi:hypothetical protein
MSDLSAHPVEHASHPWFGAKQDTWDFVQVVDHYVFDPAFYATFP